MEDDGRDGEVGWEREMVKGGNGRNTGEEGKRKVMHGKVGWERKMGKSENERKT